MFVDEEMLENFVGIVGWILDVRLGVFVGDFELLFDVEIWAMFHFGFEMRFCCFPSRIFPP